MQLLSLKYSGQKTVGSNDVLDVVQCQILWSMQELLPAGLQKMGAVPLSKVLKAPFEMAFYFQMG